MIANVRIPKSYLVNGVLLVLAIASWAIALRLYSPERRQLEFEEFTQSFLNRHLPANQGDFQLVLDDPTGTPVPVFPPLKGRSIGPAELEQINIRAQFSVAMGTARKTADHQEWTKLGSVLVFSANSEPSTVGVYETDDGHLGFEFRDVFYSVEGDALEPVLTFIHTAKKKAANQVAQ